jgi:uncharacterized protein (TIGR02598 family)
MSGGFSLVEVSLALGIIIFAILPMLALLPVGLSTLGEARDQVTETHILNGLSANVRVMSFQEVANLSARGYFDLAGRPVTEEEAVYRADITASGPNYAGTPPNVERTLLAVRCVLTNLRKANLPAHTYTIHVAKSR